MLLVSFSRVFLELLEGLKAVDRRLKSNDKSAEIMDVTIMFVTHYTLFHDKLFCKMSLKSKNLKKRLRKSRVSNAWAAIFKKTDFF